MQDRSNSRAKYHRQWYLRNRVDKLAKNKVWQYAHIEEWKYYLRKRNQHIQDIIRQLKNKPCSECQGWFDHWQMDFDHRIQSEKKFNISQPGARSIKNVLQEIAKCDLVCANCHRTRTRRKEQYHHYVRKNPVLLG